MRKKSAFTLIELLVVVAIIAILAALLFPSIASFLEKGRAADDAAKLSSLGKMLSIQLADSKGTFFEAGASGDEAWPKIIYRNYANKDWAPFRSPFDKSTSSRPKGKTEDPVPVSYGLNTNLFDTYDGKWKAPRSTLIVAAVALTNDENNITFKPDAVSNANIKLDQPSGNGTTVTKHGTHEKRTKINALFADWHVAPLEIQRYEDSTTERGKQQWQPDYEPE